MLSPWHHAFFHMLLPVNLGLHYVAFFSPHCYSTTLLDKYGDSMAGLAGAVWTVTKCVQPVLYMDKTGIWEEIRSALIEQDLVDETTLMLDSTTVKVHQHASGAKKRGRHEETGWSRGGLTTKSPCGNGWAWQSVAFLLSRGNCNDIRMAQSQLEPFDLNGKLILADKCAMTAINLSSG